MTVEEYLREQCDLQVKKLLAHAQVKIAEFQAEAAKTKAELAKMTQLPESKFATL
jgi:hypothetical protein